MTFNGFEQILKSVIKETCHSNEKLSEVARYDAAMRALFGKYHTNKAYKRIPAEMNLRDMLEIVRLIEAGQQKETAIKAVLKEKFKGLKEKELKEKVESLMGRIKIELKRNYGYYKNYNLVDIYADLKDNPYYTDKVLANQRAAREKIFTALRDAGWPV